METPDGRTLRGARARQATRARIVDESRRVLRSEHELTVKGLAQELNLSRVTVYSHFPTIQDILKALSNELLDELFSNLTDAPADAREHLQELVSSALDLLVNDSVLVRRLALATVPGDSISDLLKNDLEALLISLVEQIDPPLRPVTTDPALSARIMVTYFRGALYGWAAGFIDDETFALEVRRSSTLAVSSASTPPTRP